MRRLARRASHAIAITVLAGILAACSTTVGRFVPNDHFVFPNSNLTELGPTKASTTSWGFLFLAPSIDVNDSNQVYEEALSQVQGANVVVNFREDTTMTQLFLVSLIKYSIEGTAAKMVVGEQELR